MKTTELVCESSTCTDIAWRKFEKFYLEVILQKKNTLSFPFKSNVAPKMYFKQAEWKTPTLATEKRYSTEKNKKNMNSLALLTAVSTKPKWVLSTVLLPMCSVFPWGLIDLNVLILSLSLSNFDLMLKCSKALCVAGFQRTWSYRFNLNIVSILKSVIRVYHKGCFVLALMHWVVVCSQ